MGKIKVMSRASEGKARFAHDSDGEIVRGPGFQGNTFDVVMADENAEDLMEGSYKIVDVLRDRGVCLVEANASCDVLMQAYDEAEALWASGDFGPPLQVSEEATVQEVELWNSLLYQDHPKVHWVKMGDESDMSAATHENTSEKTKALQVLAQRMLDFANHIREVLAEETGVVYSHFWNPMLTCYTGNRTYNLHLDNPHGEEDCSIPDNGLRVAITYYINPWWDPSSGYNGGGLDIHLTDPSKPPSSMVKARSTDKVRIAPHADTMVFFLAERMAHQVVETRGPEKIFSMTMWCIDEEVLQDFIPRFHEMLRRLREPGDEEDCNSESGAEVE